MSAKDIVVVGYPRSGNTWLARLLGDYLDSPVTGFQSARPIATEGLDRKGGYIVRQLHLKPVRGGAAEFLVSPQQANINALQGERIVFAIRDPRDVAVSASFYWEKPLGTIINAMKNGVHPLEAVGQWVDFNRAWLDLDGNIPVAVVPYELMVENGEDAFGNLLVALGLAKTADDPRIASAYQRQDIHSKRLQIQSDGDGRPYGKTIQLKHLRKGVAGDWKNYFSKNDLRAADLAFGSFAKSIGYNEEWDIYEQLRDA